MAKLNTHLTKPTDSISLVNALQLCLNTRIESYKEYHPIPESGLDSELSLKFKSDASKEKSFSYFLKLVDAQWNKKNKQLIIKKPEEKISETVQNFLMLSRLKKENMKALAQLDSQYNPLLRKIFGEALKNNPRTIHKIQEASYSVFSQVDCLKMTHRQLSEKSGLSQVAISNFKAGKDIKLSNLLKLLHALDLKLHIT